MSYRDDLDAFLRRQAADRESALLELQFQNAQARRRRVLFAMMVSIGALVGAAAVVAACWPSPPPEKPPLRALKVRLLDPLCRDKPCGP